MRPRVAILHHARSFDPLELRRSIAGAADPIWVLVDQPPEMRNRNRLFARLGAVVEIDSSRLDEAGERIAAARPDGIVTFVDDHLVLAAEMSARLGLPGHSPAVARRLANKRLQRETLAAAGVPGPRFWGLPEGLGADEVAVIATRVRYPAVVKPAYGSGSRGIVRTDSPADLQAGYAGVECVVEELLLDDPAGDPRLGGYLSVESVISGGTVSHVALTGRFPLASDFRETGNFVPAVLPVDTREAVLAIADAVIVALEVESGVLHTEIKLTASGPRLIEVNGRLGGRPPFVLRQVSDVNLFEVACLVAAGRAFASEGLVACAGIGFWRMVQPPEGVSRVREVGGIAALDQHRQITSAAVLHGAGSIVDSRAGTDAAVVAVQGRVATIDELVDIAALIDRAVTVEYEPVTEPQVSPIAR